VNAHNSEFRLIEVLFTVLTHGALTDILVVVPPVQHVYVFLRMNLVLITLFFPKIMLYFPSETTIGDNKGGRLDIFIQFRIGFKVAGL